MSMIIIFLIAMKLLYSKNQDKNCHIRAILILNCYFIIRLFGHQVINYSSKFFNFFFQYI